MRKLKERYCSACNKLKIINKFSRNKVIEVVMHTNVNNAGLRKIRSGGRIIQRKLLDIIENIIN